jgi:hypothetical protein
VCEQFVAHASEPFRIEELWPFAQRLERFGIAGFGWGASWLTAGGHLDSYRDLRAFRDDAAGADRVGKFETVSLLVHLRRPSRLSTITIPDTQPFLDPAGRFAFGHNGDLERWRLARNGYRAAGRIHGRADSEVAARWLEDEWRGPAEADAVLARMHAQFGGQANLAVLARTGGVTAHAGNTENPIFAFRLGRIIIASTGAYSLDRSLFRLAAPGARERRLIRVGSSVTLAGSRLDAVAASA